MDNKYFNFFPRIANNYIKYTISIVYTSKDRLNFKLSHDDFPFFKFELQNIEWMNEIIAFSNREYLTPSPISSG